MKKKSLISILLACAMLVAVPAGCDNTNENTGEGQNAQQSLVLPAPVVQVSSNGTITWRAVEHAARYEVVLDGQKYTTTDTSFEGFSDRDFTYSVKAIAEEGYENSPATTGTHKADLSNMEISISSPSEVKSGGSIQLTATVKGAANKEVVWSLDKGGEFVTLSSNGTVTAREVTGGFKQVVVRATSVANPEKYATRQITVLSKTQLTQSMLDALTDSDAISFVGTLDIDLYTFGLFTRYAGTQQLDVETSMDGSNWHAGYTNGDTGLPGHLYYKDIDGYANEISVSYMNDENYFPLMTEKGEPATWEEAGLYNNFKGLKTTDFFFNEDTWKWEYSGADDKLAGRMVASANPYDFLASDRFSLMIDDGDIIGFYAESEEDYTLAQGYMGIQKLYAFVNGYGADSVEVPKITKFKHIQEEGKAGHDELQEAIDNMRALKNYKVEYTELVGTIYTTGYDEDGFIETVTENNCYFQPFTVNSQGNQVMAKNAEYGYHKVNDELYNTIYRNSDGSGYYATRAYEGSIDEVKPSFAFAAEIFPYISENKDGSVTYMVDENMTQVASRLYCGVGNDIALYGLCATLGYLNTGTSMVAFTPYVVVKDGYIVEACFYFNLSYYMYGYVYLEYSEFGTATIENEELFVPETVRQVPTEWSQLEVIKSASTTGAAEDEMVNALEYFKEMFEYDDIASELPFFGAVLGDTFAFGLSTKSMHGGSVAIDTMQIYYDVPLEADYTINGAMNSVKTLLKEYGFTADRVGVFTKEYSGGNICVEVVDSGLDLFIHVWRTKTASV